MTKYILDLQLFATATIETGNTLASTNPTYLNTNTTGQNSLSAENRIFYNQTLIDIAGPKLVHWQGGQKKAIPQRNGKTIQFRSYAPLTKALTPLTEGITPSGDSLSVTAVTATVNQYGKYVTISDVLDMVAIDDNLLQAVKLLGDNAGLTIDTIAREIINGGNNVYYCPKVNASTGVETEVDDRDNLDTTCELTVDVVNTIVAQMKKDNVPTINGYYHAIIHPFVAYRLKKDPLWNTVKTYSDPADWYAGEIGEIGGVRFFETSEAKIFMSDAVSPFPVFSTIFYGQDAYGVVDIEGGGVETFIEQLGSGGTSDPLHQRATAGWKGTAGGLILVDKYLVRCESRVARFDSKITAAN